VHFNPRVNPFTRSEDESVSGVGASACFTQNASRTEPYLELGRYNSVPHPWESGGAGSSGGRRRGRLEWVKRQREGYMVQEFNGQMGSLGCWSDGAGGSLSSRASSSWLVILTSKMLCSAR
jgi:hypothetical protein